jgi:hypothetical protein
MAPLVVVATAVIFIVQPEQAKLTTVSATPVHHLDCDFDALIHWTRENGATIHPNVSLSGGGTPGDYRKVTANGTIEAGSLIASIPKQLVLDGAGMRIRTGWTALNYTGAGLYHELLDGALLATRLLTERRQGTSSFFSPYLRCLPRACQCLVCASEATLGLLPSDLQEPARTARDAFLLVWQRQRGNWPFEPAPSAQEWLEAAGLAISRKWSSGMIPLADMLNHCPEAGMLRYDGGVLQHTKEAVATLRGGEEVLQSYTSPAAPTESLQLLLKYGFAPTAPAHAFEMLRWEIPLPFPCAPSPPPASAEGAPPGDQEDSGCEYVRGILAGLRDRHPRDVAFDDDTRGPPSVPAGSAPARPARPALPIAARLALRFDGSFPPAAAALVRAFVHSHPTAAAAAAAAAAGETAAGGETTRSGSGESTPGGEVSPEAGGAVGLLRPSRPQLQALLRCGGGGAAAGRWEAWCRRKLAAEAPAAEAERVVGALLRAVVTARLAGMPRCKCAAGEGAGARVEGEGEGAGNGGAAGGGDEEAGSCSAMGQCAMRGPVLAFGALRCSMLCRALALCRGGR